MKKIIRNRREIAACRAMIARLFERDEKILKLSIAARRGNPWPTPDEQARIAELHAVSESYRAEEQRYLLTAAHCGADVLICSNRSLG